MCRENMDNKDKKENNTVIYGDVKINGPTQIGGSYNSIITGGYDNEPKPTYDITPIWRSPFTLGVLTWLSAIFGLFSLIPFWSLLKPALNLFTGAAELQVNNNIIPVIAFAVLLILTVVFFAMRDIAKKQIMRPLMRGIGIDGHGRRIVFNKVHPGRCPKCGGEMIYYNKPIERDINGEVSRKMPVLECKRNPDHCFPVDVAEARVDE